MHLGADRVVGRHTAVLTPGWDYKCLRRQPPLCHLLRVDTDRVNVYQRGQPHGLTTELLVHLIRDVVSTIHRRGTTSSLRTKWGRLVEVVRTNKVEFKELRG